MTTFGFRSYENHLLSALPVDERRALTPHLQLVSLHIGQLLCDSGQRIQFVYFPTTAIISLLHVMEDASSAEVAAIGCEGMTGVPVFSGGDTMPNCVQVQSPGFAYRMSASVLRGHFDRLNFLHKLMFLYMQALLTQVAQTAACNRHHSVSKQLCRWLLMEIDRTPLNPLPMTQQMIADMLGVRREGVTEASRRLHDAGLIRQSRGNIGVLDRQGLEARACECYGIVKREFGRLLPDARACANG